MQRERVVDRVPYALRLEMRLKLVASRCPDGVLVEDVHVGRIGVRRAERRMAGERLGVAGGVPGPRGAPVGEVRQLGQQDRGLQRIQPAVEPETVQVARVRAVVAQFADPRFDVRIVGHHRAAIAEGAEIFLDDKAGGRRIA